MAALTGAVPLPPRSLSPLTEQQRHVLQQHEQQLQQLQQLLTSQPLNPVREGVVGLGGTPRWRSDRDQTEIKPIKPELFHPGVAKMCLGTATGRAGGAGGEDGEDGEDDEDGEVDEDGEDFGVTEG